MAYLTDEEIASLSNLSLTDSKILITRGKSQREFILLKPHAHGKKGLVWKGKDDVGNDVAVKFIPHREYGNNSMTDEIFKAQKLSSKYFVEIIFFGEVTEPNSLNSLKLYSVVTRWINGDSFEDYVNNDLSSVNQFLFIAETIFHALADLKAHNLSHDDLHKGNIMVEKSLNHLKNEEVYNIKIIDTGTIKSLQLRDTLLNELRNKISLLEENGADPAKISWHKELLEWKEPDDHVRVIECLMIAANSLVRNYYKLDFWERRFIDSLQTFFGNTTDDDPERRIQSPDRVMSVLYTIENASKKANHSEEKFLRTPFDYPSSEMIRDDKEFALLFSKECPWLDQSKSIRSLYIYGPRGSGKSTVLRWLSFKAIIAGPNKAYNKLSEIGIYISCSVELRSRFWLLNESAINLMEVEIIKFFNLLLLEELFDTLDKMLIIQNSGEYNFGFVNDKLSEFSKWVLKRLDVLESNVRLEGLGYFEYLRITTRKVKWETWSRIQKSKPSQENSDPALISDICKEISNSFDYFNKRTISFLIDDYSNQRIPVYLQKKLNKTISFAKQAMPIFKVTSEYNGVDLEGIDRSREVTEINIGEKYTSLEENGTSFIENILNKRLENTTSRYKSKIIEILGRTKYQPDEMADAIANEKNESQELFYYSGLDCIHWICSGDIALVLELVKKIFDNGGVTPSSTQLVSDSIQHKTIQQFSQEEVKRLRYIVPYGDKIYEIVCQLSLLSHTIVKNKLSGKTDRNPTALCKTHLDIKNDILTKLETDHPNLFKILSILNSKAILFSLNSSRTRRTGTTERFQIRRIYLPAFKAPLKRDQAIKIDTIEELKSMLSDPYSFCKREVARTGIEEIQFDNSIQDSDVKIIGVP
jgi:serine/threonine protein kinase